MLIKCITVQLQVMDRADRDAMAALIGTIEWQRRTTRQLQDLHELLQTMAVQVDENRRTIGSYLQSAKHLFANRTAVVETVADEHEQVSENRT